MASFIDFCDLSRAQSPLRSDIDAAISRVIDSHWYLRGKETAAFEEEWAAYCGQAHCVTCNSGTDALTLAAMALNLRRADVQANTLPLTAIGLQRGGAEIVVAEVDDSGRLASLTEDSVPVLLFGRLPSQAEAGARLFDAAHAHGWKPPAEAAACWSFYPTKSLGGLGDGGAVTTNDEGQAEAMRELSGLDDRFYSGRQLTSRMDEIQAAVLRVKLRRLDEWIDERRAIAARYRAQLPATVRPISDSPGDLHHLYVIRAPDRDGLKRHLSAAGVATKIHFPTPLNRYDAPWGVTATGTSTADRWCASILTLPCYPGLTVPEIDRICEHVADHAETVAPAA